MLSYVRLSSYCVKSERILSYSGPHFPAFGLNTERYGVSLHIQSECRKMRTRVNPNTDTFQAVSLFMQLLLLKTIHFVLSSPSWTDSLLSTNQSNTFANSLLKTFSISVTPFCTGTYEYFEKSAEYHLCIAKTTKVPIRILGKFYSLWSLFPRRQCLKTREKLCLWDRVKPFYCFIWKTYALHLI